MVQARGASPTVAGGPWPRSGRVQGNARCSAEAVAQWQARRARYFSPRTQGFKSRPHRAPTQETHLAGERWPLGPMVLQLGGDSAPRMTTALEASTKFIIKVGVASAENSSQNDLATRRSFTKKNATSLNPAYMWIPLFVDICC